MDFEYPEGDSVYEFNDMDFEFPEDQMVDGFTFQDAQNSVAVEINVSGKKGTSLQTLEEIEVHEKTVKQGATSEAAWIEAEKGREQKNEERTKKLILGEQERMERLMAKTVELSKKVPRTKLRKEKAKENSQMAPAKEEN